MTGRTISHFKVLEKIGAGGMGEVYLAEDTKLDRQVALKVLPPHALASEDDRARFYREARAAAALNHTNIGHVYEIDEVVLESGEKRPFIAMEYVDGESLAERITRGPLPLQDVIAIGSQIASGLSAAHAKDIVHRDIKPGNVMLSKAGEAKILDFGLAKTAASTKLTRMGSTLGTFAYMSPEQARGEEVDARTDVWSLGAVLFEMITGRVPFPGEYQQAVVYGILNEDPEPPTAVRTGVPMELERIVLKCLSKDRRQRYQHIDEVAVDLQTTDSGGSASVRTGSLARTPARVAAQSRRPVVSWRSALVMFGALVFGGLAVWASMQSSIESSKPVLRSTIPLPLGSFAGMGSDHRHLAISPDGRRLVYVARIGTTERLYVRAMDEFGAEPVQGTEGASSPFFSPDGQWVGFFADRQLKKVLLGGGSPIKLCEIGSNRGGSWGPDNTIVFSKGIRSGLWVVSADGGVPRVLTNLDSTRAESGHRWPHILPNRNAVLFTVKTADIRSFDDASIAVYDIKTGRRFELFEGGTGVRYVPTGHLVYARGNALLGVPFDPERLELTGSHEVLVDSVSMSPYSGSARFDVSASGTLVYRAAPSSLNRSLLWWDREGNVIQRVDLRRAFQQPRLSPSGQLLAVGIPAANNDIYVYEIERGTNQRLTFRWENQFPIWSPDGTWIAFSSERLGSFDLFRRRADGSGDADLLLSSEQTLIPGSWSSDGESMAYTAFDPQTEWDIWVLSVRGQTEPTPYLRTSFNETDPTFSPDGRYMAYVSDESGEQQVYVQTYPIPGGKESVSIDGGLFPVWNPNGSELFYLNGNSMMSVTFSAGPPFSLSLSRELFRSEFMLRDFVVTPDGDTFASIEPGKGGESSPDEVRVVLNWFEEVKDLFSGDK